MPYNDILDESIALAKKWQERANELLTKEEKKIQAQMQRLLNNPIDKAILTKLIDQSFRTSNAHRVANQISEILKEKHIPSFFSINEKALSHLFLGIGQHIPFLSIPKIIEKIRKDSSRMIIPGELEAFNKYLEKRKQEQLRVNLNHLGEAVLGEQEALSRFENYINTLKNPDIEYISIKISTIYSQINSLAFEQTIEILKKRLKELYKTSANNFFTRNDGTQVPKFINLDMEEFKDLEITSLAFTQTLDMQELQYVSAGIALQAYLPDSWHIQQYLTKWAQNRVLKGGAPIKIRIVKGANMEMEQLEASLNNWPMPLYDNKLDVDANYKRMIEYGMAPDNIKAAHLGIASHNLFDLAYAYNLAKQNNVIEHFDFEMLEGMADHVRRAIQETSKDLILYAPVATKDTFINAIAYLIRRLDENTGPENFLRYSCDLKPDSKEWKFLEQQFIDSYNHRNSVSSNPNKIQNRQKESFIQNSINEFDNEPNTDWSLSKNRKWAEDIRQKWRNIPFINIPLVIEGQEIFESRNTIDCYDPSTLGNSVESKKIASIALANENDINKAILVAKQDPDNWRNKSFEQRGQILSNVAKQIKIARSDLIGSCAANTGKVFFESDPEVSEAIDFTHYYNYSANIFAHMKNLECSGKGVGLVISPWNFPIAIPCGGIMAALAAGNTVLFKPSAAAAYTAWQLCNAIWNAGISKNILQFLPCDSQETGDLLTNNPYIDFIIFTGSTDTALHILNKRPDILLAAETGGKNATIVTAMSDRDLAIKNIIHSAFSHCGQKCSATSLLILEKEVYEDANFKKQLIDAVKSYPVGFVWDFKSKMATLIEPPKGKLLKALISLEPGESWALEPKNILDNPYLWTPGIKWDVQPGSPTHMTEFFGPILGVMKADNLEHAIKLVNQTGYGLTSGLESLDQREHALWKSKMKAGNLYINKVTTGAVVLRQPFGGIGKSAIGAGIKAGGPNYVSQFMNFKEIETPFYGAVKDHFLLRIVNEWKNKRHIGIFKQFRDDIEKVIKAVKSYLYNMENEFSVEKDYFNLRGQDNISRYLAIGKVIVRVHEKDTLFEILARIGAVIITKCELIISIPHDLNNDIVKFLLSNQGQKFSNQAIHVYESDEDIANKIDNVNLIRYASFDRIPDIVLKKAAQHGFYMPKVPVMMEGRIELLQYVKEQSISCNYHRYGNLGERASIPTTPLQYS